MDGSQNPTGLAMETRTIPLAKATRVCNLVRMTLLVRVYGSVTGAADPKPESVLTIQADVFAIMGRLIGRKTDQDNPTF